jgi:hypothetical protein
LRTPPHLRGRRCNLRGYLDNPCQLCDPARDQFAWSNNDGATCDDDLFCTTEDACNAGRCEGTPRECDDGVACNGVSTCVEESDSCSPDVNECANGTVCSVAARACVSTCTGCLISGVCVETGAEEAGNPCRICDPGRSIDAFSAAVGKACGAAASVCSQRDTCNAQGACQPNDLPPGTPCGDSESSTCDQSDACDGSGVCQPRRAVNGTPCNDGLFCTASDRCQGGACVGSGATCIANQTCNETTNQCACAGGTLSCASPLGGSPNCSSWDFESNGAEGWEFDLESAGSSDAHVGQLTSSSAVPAPRGNRSLAVRFQGTGTPGRTMVFIRVPLCAGGSSVDISGRQLQALVRLVTDPGTNPLTTQQGHLVSLYTADGQFPFAGGDFSVDPATGGGSGPLGWHVVNVDLSEQFGDRTANAVELGFRLLVDSVWSGTVYIDDIRLI